MILVLQALQLQQAIKKMCVGMAVNDMSLSRDIITAMLYH